MQWLHRIDRTVIALEEKTLAVRFVLESQAVSLRAKAGVALDELVLIEGKILGDTGDLLFGNLHLPGPAATRSAALALVVNVESHFGKVMDHCSCAALGTARSLF